MNRLKLVWVLVVFSCMAILCGGEKKNAVNGTAETAGIGEVPPKGLKEIGVVING